MVGAFDLLWLLLIGRADWAYSANMYIVHSHIGLLWSCGGSDAGLGMVLVEHVLDLRCGPFVDWLGPKCQG